MQNQLWLKTKEDIDEKVIKKGIAFGDEILFSTSKGFSIKGVHKRKEKNKLHFLLNEASYSWLLTKEDT